jgi:hypothetical protein
MFSTFEVGHLKSIGKSMNKSNGCPLKQCGPHEQCKPPGLIRPRPTPPNCSSARALCACQVTAVPRVAAPGLTGVHRRPTCTACALFPPWRHREDQVPFCLHCSLPLTPPRLALPPLCRHHALPVHRHIAPQASPEQPPQAPFTSSSEPMSSSSSCRAKKHPRMVAPPLCPPQGAPHR